MKNNAIVIGFDKLHSFAAGTFMINLIDTCSDNISEFVLISEQFDDSDLKVFKGIAPCTFIDYICPVRYDVNNPPFAVSRFTQTVFSKFECLRLLRQYDSLVWLDYDQVVTGDLSDLFSYNSNYLKVIPGNCKVRDQFLEPVVEFDMNAEGICGSVISFGRGLADADEMYDFCIEMSNKYIENLRLGEQAIFDIMIQYFLVDCELLDPKVYTPHPTDLHVADAKLLHAYGGPKFWNGLHSDIWERHYRDWLNRGGSRYTDLDR